MLVDLLEYKAFEVFEAADAAEAIEVLKAHTQIGVVITDIQMPGSMDGLALARFIRDSYPPILLIVASGAVRPSRHDLPCEAVFLPKPIDPTTLAEILGGITAS